MHRRRRADLSPSISSRERSSCYKRRFRCGAFSVDESVSGIFRFLRPHPITYEPNRLHVTYSRLIPAIEVSSLFLAGADFP